MAYQNLFEALQNVCGFTALESDMFEIINAYEKDKAEQLPQSDDIAHWKPCGEGENICNCKEASECGYTKFYEGISKIDID